jgi:hypothetical protein
MLAQPLRQLAFLYAIFTSQQNIGFCCRYGLLALYQRLLTLPDQMQRGATNCCYSVLFCLVKLDNFNCG